MTAWLPGAEVLSLLPRKIILSVLTGLSYSTGALHRSQARQRLLCVLKLADSVPSPRDEESELSCKLTEGPPPIPIQPPLHLWKSAAAFLPR